jgi:hypothetical protein
MSLWSDSHAATIDVENFRAPDQYLSQPVAYPFRALVEYVRGEWPWLLDELDEDGAFGCVTENVDGKVVSRDLLDSICEIGFLLKCIEPGRYVWSVGPATSRSFVPTARVLDIGAGYGRFAHRLTSAFPLSFVYCADAIDVSMDVCVRYLNYRNAKRAAVIGPAELHNLLGILDVAVNIHSWSECTLAEVRGWLDWLVTLEVPRLFIVPHEPTFATLSGGPSYLPELEARGFKMTREWTGPPCWPRLHAMFERSR